MNLAYGALTDEVHDWGGSVIDFSGDAIMCWFDDAPDGGVATSSGASRAVSCALRMQELIAGLPPLVVGDGEPFGLSIKVAVVSGQMRRSAVGDVKYRLVDVIAGPGIDRVAGLERHALQGEVVVDEPTAAEVAGLQVGRWKPGDDTIGRVAVLDPASVIGAVRHPWPEVSLDASVAADWVDGQLRDRPEASLTELRPVAALFVRFGAIDLVDARGVDAFDSFVRRVQHVVASHGGCLLQITMGDKGGYLYVAFGAPTAHEDVAARAGAAALDLCGPSSDNRVAEPLRCGLTLGLTRTGAYGGPVCRTYGAVGESVNLAAHLMAIAGPGEILASPGFARSCGADFVFDELAPIPVKGYPTPIPVKRLTRRERTTSHGRYGAALFGRGGELQEVLALVGLVTTGPGGTLVIEGEAGIGKSHLVERVRHTLLDSEDVSWFECPANERAAGSLAAFLPLLADLFFQELGPTPEDRRQLFEATIDATIDDLEAQGTTEAHEACRSLRMSQSYIGALLGLRWDGSAYEHHDPRSRFERCLRAVDDLLQAESMRRPVVIHLRDAHWLDADSAALVARLADSSRRLPLAILIDQRPLGPGRRSWSEQTFPHQRLELAGLDGDGVRHLVETLLGGAGDPDLVDAILKRSGGNPLFVEQLVFDLRERELLVADANARWRLAGDIERDLPPTLTAVLLSRIDRLGTASRVAVQLAAVLGSEFDGDTLREMARGDLAESELAEAFTAVERSGVWRPVADRPGRTGFSHALLRQIAYDTQLDERLRLLHARAGSAIEATRSPGEPGRAAELGHHAERAGDPARAWSNFVSAGRESVAQSAHGPALAFFERALVHGSAAAIAPSELFVVRSEAGDLADLLGQYARAVEHYDAALELDGSAVRDRTGLLHRTARSFERWGRYDEAERRYDRAIDELQGDLDVGIAAGIYSGLSMVHCRRDALDNAEELAELALLFAETARVPALLAEAHKTRGIVHLRSGRFYRAAVDSQMSLDIYTELGDPAGQAAVWNNMGLLATADGRTAEAIASFRTSVGLFERAGNDHGLANALDNLAGALHEVSEEAEAMECLEQAIGILASIGVRGHDVFGAMWKSGTW